MIPVQSNSISDVDISFFEIFIAMAQAGRLSCVKE
jgi:hypothetical protein